MRFLPEGLSSNYLQFMKISNKQKMYALKRFFFLESQEGSGLVKRLSLYHHMKTVTTYSGEKKRKKEEKDIVS